MSLFLHKHERELIKIFEGNLESEFVLCTFFWIKKPFTRILIVLKETSSTSIAEKLILKSISNSEVHAGGGGGGGVRFEWSSHKIKLI